MKRFEILIILLINALSCFAQQLEIASPLTHEGSVSAASVPTDNNGNPCAKIIVELPLEDAVIEGAYIVGNVKEKAGRYEFYVSVPKKKGQKFSIRHSNYGSIDIPIWTEQGALVGREAYIVKLKAKSDEKVIVDMHGNAVVVGDGNFEIVKHEDVGGQYLVMTVSPADASVEIDGQSVTVNDGGVSKLLSYGKHTYKVEHSMYEAKSGTFDIGSDKLDLKVALAPIFGFLKIITSPESGADVYINGRKAESKTPYVTKELKEGDYTIKVTKQMYNSAEKVVTVVRNKTSEVDMTMIPAFGNVTIISADANASLTVDGRDVGTGSWTGRMEHGKHLIEAKRANHRTASKTIDVVANTQLQVDIDAPTPIVGSLNISSNPIGATIKIDGKDMGETPNIIKELLIGNHTVSLSKQGCSDYENTIVIEEGKVTAFEATLEKGKQVTISTDKSGDKVYIDGQLAGTSPLNASLSFGTHNVYAMRGNEKSEVEKVNVTSTTSNNAKISLRFIQPVTRNENNGYEAQSSSKQKSTSSNNSAYNAPDSYSRFEWLTTRRVTEKDLQGLSKTELRILRNAIYAIHGYIFKTKDMKSYFSKLSWYTPISGDATYIYNKFSSIEKANIDFIKRHE